MSEEGYKPSKEEVKSAEEHLKSVPEQEMVSHARESFMNQLTDLGLSEATIKGLEYSTGLGLEKKDSKIRINGHEVYFLNFEKGIVCKIDGEYIPDSEQSKRLYKLESVLRELYVQDRMFMRPNDSKESVESAKKIQDVIDEIFQ